MPDIAFATPAGPVEVTGLTPDLLQAFRAQAPDWPEADGGDPIGEVTVAPDPGGWRFVSSNYDAPDFVFDPGLGAGNGLIGCLIHSFVAASPGSIALHAGAVETEDGLTVLAGDMMAGKSTLTLALAALGHRVWCDDRLPVENKDGGFSGTALGLRRNFAGRHRRKRRPRSSTSLPGAKDCRKAACATSRFNRRRAPPMAPRCRSAGSFCWTGTMG
ncbi:MAG: hypothetical protein ACMVY4_07375 [Minwuia sp.]|uniref:hypothetical protein n=1 Tax=Minwuia sp. TaxID=2493630 RepID=UPI003A86B954